MPLTMATLHYQSFCKSFLGLSYAAGSGNIGGGCGAFFFPPHARTDPPCSRRHAVTTAADRALGESSLHNLHDGLWQQR